mmetsp:Transcript_103188/g.259904  ORF Transcript_103188/g.259904 Transcript_103188/m.259904 type:complete len:279 (-) Transcript_103188:123-959(-)
MMPSSGGAFTSTWHAASSASARSERIPRRTSLRTWAKSSSEACRTQSRSTTVPRSNLQRAHAGAWKQNCRAGAARPCTGGSCKKSPQRMSCSPPKAASRRPSRIPRTLDATTSRASKRLASSMETSSITSTVVWRHLAIAAGLFCTLPRSRLGGPSPRPTPAKLWMVWPLMLAAAMPVEAVTATCPGYWLSSSCMMYLNRKLFPVPAAPVRKRLSPCSARSAAARCSAVSCSASMRTGGGGGALKPSSSSATSALTTKDFARGPPLLPQDFPPPPPPP